MMAMSIPFNGSAVTPAEQHNNCLSGFSPSLEPTLRLTMIASLLAYYWDHCGEAERLKTLGHFDYSWFI